MNVLVTGGAGFIGANLLHGWHARHPHDALRTLDALTYAGHRRSLEPLIADGVVDFHHGDVSDPAAVRAAARGVDLIVHLAAESHVDRSIDAPAPFVRTNVVGTQVLLDAARALDVPRVHLVSTDEVFGSLPIDRPEARFTLSTPYDPRSPYSATKAAADHLVRAYHHTYGLAATISNCGNNYGPYQHPEKLIPRAITRLLANERVPVYGHGRNVRDWIHVEDHARAIERIATAGRPGATYLVGAGQERTNLEVVRTLLAEFGRGDEAIEFVPDRPGHDLRYALDARPMQEELGWQPEIRFEDGIRRTVAWYRARTDWWRPLLPDAERRGAPDGATQAPSEAAG